MFHARLGGFKARLRPARPQHRPRATVRSGPGGSGAGRKRVPVLSRWMQLAPQRRPGLGGLEVGGRCRAGPAALCGNAAAPRLDRAPSPPGHGELQGAAESPAAGPCSLALSFPTLSTENLAALGLAYGLLQWEGFGGFVKISPLCGC